MVGLLYGNSRNQDLHQMYYRTFNRWAIQRVTAVPKRGDVIKGSGGLRKLCWESKNNGKSCVIRNIYYYYEDGNTIYMLYVYPKGKQDNLSPKEVTLLKSVLEGIL